MNYTINSLIDWASLPRREVESGHSIIAVGDPTELLFCLETGQATTDTNTLCETFTEGDYVLLCEGLALDRYATSVIASCDCSLVAVSRETLRKSLGSGGAIVWPISQSIAIEVTQRRLAG